jgi:tRNA/tmRNA/rRNA uracil-C5-methylase (TrmA/RlmC/RlmD family)
METPLEPNHVFVSYKPPHNHYLSLYESCRNSYCFTKVINYDICNEQVKDKINFLQSLSFPFDEKCEIRTTELTWMMKYNGKCKKEIIEKILDDTSLVYLELDKIIFRNELMQDKINNVLIKYNPLSFRQSDDSIKYKVYEVLQQYIFSSNIYFIGGEMTFYSKLFQKLNKVYMITDYESIYEDAKRNINENENNIIKMIDYDKDELIKPEFINDFTLITNSSIQGLGENLSNEILKLEIKTIFIISCNSKSFYRDYEILKRKYEINKIFEIKTNYIVTIYLLKLF